MSRPRFSLNHLWYCRIDAKHVSKRFQEVAPKPIFQPGMALFNDCLIDEASG